MAGSTKNLGQVAGVYIGNNPPENVILIWYDNTPSQQRHKVYDPTLKQWVVLDQTTISAITYSELVNMAKNVGLAIGQWFQIKDKGNALALAITTTKVQYDDAMGNILIDDLGTNIQYHVTSSNLSIDDVTGVFDEVNKKLVFRFNEVVPDFTANDYIMGKIQRNNVWSLAKYRLSSFLSKVTGNSISWNGGFFFNFAAALKDQLDKKGGVVAKDTYDRDMTLMNQNIQNVGKANQQIIDNANKAITEATSDTAIYAKKSPALETGGEPIDAAKGDSLSTVLSKFQRYINRFKYATGIKLTKGFSPSKEKSPVNNNDTVESAIQKLAKYSDLYATGDNILVSSEDFVISDNKPEPITKDDTITIAIAKLAYLSDKVKNVYPVEDLSLDSNTKLSCNIPSDVFAYLKKGDIIEFVANVTLKKPSSDFSSSTVICCKVLINNNSIGLITGEKKTIAFESELNTYSTVYSSFLISNKNLILELYGDVEFFGIGNITAELIVYKNNI